MVPISRWPVRIGNRNRIAGWRHGCQSAQDFGREDGTAVPLALGVHHGRRLARLNRQESSFERQQGRP